MAAAARRGFRCHVVNARAEHTRSVHENSSPWGKPHQGLNEAGTGAGTCEAKREYAMMHTEVLCPASSATSPTTQNGSRKCSMKTRTTAYSSLVRYMQVNISWYGCVLKHISAHGVAEGVTVATNCVCAPGDPQTARAECACPEGTGRSHAPENARAGTTSDERQLWG